MQVVAGPMTLARRWLVIRDSYGGDECGCVVVVCRCGDFGVVHNNAQLS